MYDLGLYVGWFEILHDFIGLPSLYGLKYDSLIALVIGIVLDGSIIAGIGARFNTELVIWVFKTKVLFYKISLITYSYI